MIERPDAIVCDLDGVLYRGDVGIAGAGEGLAGLRRAGIDLVFVTNNSTKTPAEAAAKITRLTGFAPAVSLLRFAEQLYAELEMELPSAMQELVDEGILGEE